MRMLPLNRSDVEQWASVTRADRAPACMPRAWVEASLCTVVLFSRETFPLETSVACAKCDVKQDVQPGGLARRICSLAGCLQDLQVR